MKVKSVVIVVCCLPVKEVIAAVTDLVPWLDAWKFDKISKKYAPPGLFFNLPVQKSRSFFAVFLRFFDFSADLGVDVILRPGRPGLHP